VEKGDCRWWKRKNKRKKIIKQTTRWNSKRENEGTENKEGKTKSAGIYRMFTKGENGRKVNEGEKNWMDENILVRENKSILVAARSKAQVCRRSIAKKCGFETDRGYGCVSLMNTVFCQVEDFATG
jgi:hypothetical protein